MSACRRAGCGIALGLCYLALSATAFAQESYNPYPLGLRTAGMGGAAAAFGHDSAMPWVNPAGIAANKGSTFGASANALVVEQLKASDYFSFSDEFVQALGASADDSVSQFDSSAVSIFPNSVSYAFQLGDDPRIFGALSFVVPYQRVEDSVVQIVLDGGSTLYSEYYSEGLRSLTFYEFGPSFAMELSDTLRLGTSLFFRYAPSESFSSTENYNHTPATKDVALFSRQFSVSSQSYDLDLGLGAQFGPFGGASIGIGVHMPSIHLTGSRSQSRRTFVGSSASTTVAIEDIDIESTSFVRKTPLWMVAGIGYEVAESFSFALDLSYWLPVGQHAQSEGRTSSRVVVNDPTEPLIEDSFDSLVTRKYGGVLNVAVGTELYVSPELILRAGFFTDRSNQPRLPEESERTPSDVGLRIYDRFGATLGIGYSGRTTRFQAGFILLHGAGDMVGFVLAPTGVTHPTREISSTTLMLAFSGEIDAETLFSTVRGTIEDQLGAASAEPSPVKLPPPAQEPPAAPAPTNSGPSGAILVPQVRTGTVGGGADLIAGLREVLTRDADKILAPDSFWPPGTTVIDLAMAAAQLGARWVVAVRIEKSPPGFSAKVTVLRVATQKIVAIFREQYASPDQSRDLGRVIGERVLAALRNQEGVP